ncbi:MAG: zf-HC2 domain-containing protein [Anaerolineales bacterium]|nr:MAG: zf-HC2 domain-containing protein [Anaerolineales bacterium]
MSAHQSCRHLLASLSEFVDGELDEKLCAEIERHLADCENCRIVIDSLEKTVSLYQTVSKTETVPDEVRERLFHRLKLDEFLES